MEQWLKFKINPFVFEKLSRTIRISQTIEKFALKLRKAYAPHVWQPGAESLSYKTLQNVLMPCCIPLHNRIYHRKSPRGSPLFMWSWIQILRLVSIFAVFHFLSIDVAASEWHSLTLNLIHLSVWSICWGRRTDEIAKQETLLKSWEKHVLSCMTTWSWKPFVEP